MRRTTALLASALLAGCSAPAQAPQLADDEVDLPPAMAATCAAEGGCVLVTRMGMERVVREVEAAAKRSCRRSDT